MFRQGRVATLILLLSLVSLTYLVGCGGGGSMAMTTSSSQALPSTAGNLSLRLTQAFGAAGSLASVAIHVQSSVTLSDIQTPTTASLAPGGSVTVSITVPVSESLRLLVVGLDDTGLTLESGVSSSLVVQPGQSQAVSVTLAASQPTSLAFTTQPANSVVNQDVAPVSVEVLDQNQVFMNGLNTLAIAVALGANPGSASLSGTLSQTTVSGVATFNNLSLNQVGNGYTLVATASGLTSSTSTAFNVAAAALAASKLVFIQNPTTTAAAATIAPPLTVAVEDANGVVVTSPAVSVSMAITTNPGNGLLEGTVTQTSVNGIATFDDLSITEPGNGYQLTASATGLSSALSGLFNITAVGGIHNVLFVMNPGAASIDGFQLPSLAAIPALTNIELPATPTVLSVGVSQGSGGGNTTVVVGLNTSSNNLLPIRVDANNVVTFLPALTLPAAPIAMDHAGTTLFVATGATSNNLFAIQVNADGTLNPTLLSTSTVGGVGNTVVPGNLSMQSLQQDTLDVITNGTTNNVTRFTENPANDFGLSATGTSLTVGGSGNTPVAITFPAQSSSNEYIVTNGAANNITAMNIDFTITSTETVGGTGNTPVTLCNGGSENFMYVLTNGAANNLTAVSTNSGGGLGAVGTPITVASGSNLPNAINAQAFQSSPLADVFGTLDGNSGNVFIVSTSGGATLGTPSFTTSSGNSPTSPSGD